MSTFKASFIQEVLSLSPSVLSLCTVNCDVVYMRVGDNSKLFCKYHTGKHEVSWTFNSQLIGRESKSGTSERGKGAGSDWCARLRHAHI